MNEYGRMLLILMLSTFVTCCKVDAATDPLEEFNGKLFSPPDPMTSYHYKDDSNWTTWNKIWFGSAIALWGVGDTVTTVNALKSDRCVEGTTILFGDNPSAGLIILSKIAAFGLSWWYIEHVLTDEEEQQNTRNVLYGVISTIGGVATCHNSLLDCN